MEKENIVLFHFNTTNGNLVNQTFAYNDEQKYIPINEVKQNLNDLRNQMLHIKIM